MHQISRQLAGAGSHHCLRIAVEISPLRDGVQLTDTETGFAVELGASDTAAMNDAGAEFARVWQALEEFGLTDQCTDLVEIRRRQRKSFAAAMPLLQDRLRALLGRIRREVPFFRDRAAIYDPDRLSSLEDFHNLPFMRKQDIRRSFPDGLIPDGIDLPSMLRDGTLLVLATSGSTDERLEIVTRSIVDRLPFGSEDLLGVPIGGQQPRTAFFTTPVCASTACRQTNGSFEDRLSMRSPDLYLKTTRNPFSIDTTLLKEFCEDIERFQPTILAADPIYLQCMIRRARRSGIQLPRVKIVQRGFEFGTRTSIRDIGKAFSVAVLNDYGASEENRIAIECHRGSLHVRADALHLEIIGRAGPCGPGVVGAVAITTFDTVTPLVRYLIGDVAAWTGTSCDCPFAHWPCIEWHGRAKDLIKCKAGWVTAAQIDRAIDAPEWLDFYRVTQLGPEAYCIMVIPALDQSANLDELRDRLGSCFDKDEIEYRIVSHLEPLPSMKIGTVQAWQAGPEIP